MTVPDPSGASQPKIIPIASDLSTPSVVVRCLTKSGWKDHANLDLTINNWSTWHQRVLLVLQMSSGLNLYLMGKVAEPNITLEPRANKNWCINDTAVCTFLKSKCSSMELGVIESCTTALLTWTTLTVRHQCQGIVSQIHLIQEAFFI